jgi:hypothetical protein
MRLSGEPRAAPVAVSKMAVEAPVVGAIQGGILALPPEVAPLAWVALVARRAADARLDPNARALMRRKIAAELDASGTRLVPLDNATFARKLAACERPLLDRRARSRRKRSIVPSTELSKDLPDALATLRVRPLFVMRLDVRPMQHLGETPTHPIDQSTQLMPSQLTLAVVEQVRSCGSTSP